MGNISRVTRSKSEAMASYDGMSAWYDLIAGSSEKKYTDAGLVMLGAVEGEGVLEIGPGTGHGLVELARVVGESGAVYGIDISGGMLDVARARLWKAGLSERVMLLRGDGSMLPFNNDSFDALFMSFTLELFDTPEIGIVLKECERVLGSRGRLCVMAMSKGKPGIVTRAYEWAHGIFPRYLDCRPIFVGSAVTGAGFRILGMDNMSMYGLAVEVVLAMKRN